MIENALGGIDIDIKYTDGVQRIFLNRIDVSQAIRENEISLGFKKEIAVCLAGVTVNFLLCVLLFLAHLKINSPLLINASAVNLILGLFNSLPVGNLDGGRAFGFYLNERLSQRQCEAVLKITSAAILIPVFLFGIFIMYSKGNFTLLICCLYLVFSSFVMARKNI